MLSIELAKQIKEYLDGSPVRSLHSLSSKTGVAYSTLREIAEGKSEKPNPLNVIPILKEVCSRSRALELVKQYFPQLSYLISGDDDENSLKASSSSVFSYLGNDQMDTFIIAMAASKKNGTDQAEIKDIFGRVGVIALERLLNNGVLKEINMRVKTHHEFILCDLKQVYSQLLHYLAYLDINDTKNNAVFLRTIGVNHQGHIALANILRKADEQVKDIYLNPDLKGEKTIFVGSFIGMIEKETDDGN